MKLLLGERIKHYRERKGMSQKALADALNADKGTVWRWEDGRSWPEYDKLIAIAEKLNIEPERLFETIGKTPAKPSPDEALKIIAEALGAQAPEIRKGVEKLPPELLEDFAKLDDLGRETVLSVIRNRLREIQAQPDRKAKTGD